MEIEKPLGMRLGDGARTFLQTLLMVYPEKEAGFIRLLKRIEAESLEAKEETFEARLLLAIEELWEGIYDGRLQTGMITEEVNKGIPEKWHKTERSVGRKLVAMGFKKGSKLDNKAAILIDPNTFKKNIREIRHVSFTNLHCPRRE